MLPLRCYDALESATRAKTTLLNLPAMDPACKMQDWFRVDPLRRARHHLSSLHPCQQSGSAWRNLTHLAPAERLEKYLALARVVRKDRLAFLDLAACFRCRETAGSAPYQPG